jgi:hypothetical protein
MPLLLQVSYRADIARSVKTRLINNLKKVYHFTISSNNNYPISIIYKKIILEASNKILINRIVL